MPAQAGEWELVRISHGNLCLYVACTKSQAIYGFEQQDSAEMGISMENNKLSEVVTQAEDKNIENPTGRTAEHAAGKAAENPAKEKAQKIGDKITAKSRRRGKKNAWVSRGILVSAALALVMLLMYGFFRDRAEEYKSSPLEEYSNIEWLYRNCYMLYRDLYNAQTGGQKNYKELFMQPGEGYEWLLEAETWGEDMDTFMGKYVTVDSASGNEWFDDGQSDYYVLREGICGFETVFRNLEENYSILNSNFDYMIRDNVSGFCLTNMSEYDLGRGVGNQYFQVGFTFNENGSVTVDEDVAGVNPAQIRKFSNEAIRYNTLSDFLGTNDTERFLRYCSLNGPVNCTVIFRISKNDWVSGLDNHFVTEMYNNGSVHFTAHLYQISNETIYQDVGMGVFLFTLLFIALLCGLLLPLPGDGKPWREVKICRPSLELLLAMGIVVFAGLGELVFELAVYTADGSMERLLYTYFFYEFAYMAPWLVNMVCLAAFFFCGWYLGICARTVRDLGIKEYIKERCIFYRIFPFIKGKALEFYDEVCRFDVTKNAHKMILKIVVLNALILFVISCFWVTGFPITVVYSVLLYFILKNYISKLQMKYGQLLHATNEIAEGNLNVKITEDLGVFEPFKPQIIRIQNGFKNAVEEETKSQRMKAELITNVSHDLKTPLTAIITYINLLKDENITEEQRKEYLDTLERKSLRLKVLIEDLFEVSKANSQTVTLNIMDVDIMNLVKQVSFEMTDKLAASDLDVRMNLTDEKIILPLDSQKTYRIYENLLGNVAKYALPGTRVYINGFRIDDTVIITMKNISAQEITVDVAELTERFVRGDASRNTEGSGLGLAIAKSFVELQGGELSLEVDGDLFKVTTSWHV